MWSGMSRSRAPSALSRHDLPQPLGPMRPYRLRRAGGREGVGAGAGSWGQEDWQGESAACPGLPAGRLLPLPLPHCCCCWPLIGALLPLCCRVQLLLEAPYSSSSCW